MRDREGWAGDWGALSANGGFSFQGNRETSLLPRPKGSIRSRPACCSPPSAPPLHSVLLLESDAGILDDASPFFPIRRNDRA